MPRPKAPRAAVAAALAEVAAGATHAEASARHGIGERTLRRAVAEGKSAPKPKARPRGKTGPKARRDEEDSPALLETLVAELRDARRERKNPENTDAENRAWAKTIRELVSAIERIAPPPPVPPDQVQAELRRLDAVTIGLIEQFLAEPIRVEDVA